MKTIPILLLLLLTLLLSSCQEELKEIAISSPDLKLQLIFKLEKGKPSYKLNLNGKAILLESAMGFTLKDAPALDGGFKLLGSKIQSNNSEWNQPWGEVRTIKNNYRELTVYLQEISGSQRLMNVIFRLYNYGLGFRYNFPEQENLTEFQITEEKTQYTLPSNDTVWWIPAYKRERYEYLYRRTHLSEIDTAHTPVTLKTKDGLFLSFHEAALYDFPSYTVYSPDTNILAIDLVPWKNGIKAYLKAPFNTPWRTIQVAETPGDLVTEYLILNLNDSSRIGDVSWIKPAKYVGIWWGMHIGKYTWGSGSKHGATTRNAKKYIDFAAENNLNGVLVEGWNQGWDGDWLANGAVFSFTEPYPDFNLPKVAAYAAEKGVNLIGHHETSAHIDNYEAQMEDAYKLYEELGVRYLKTGYVGGKLFNGEWHHGQYGVRHYQKTVELAAKHHIMLDIHEPIKDCGLRRTWPNLMTREGARGAEWDAWGPDGGNPPNHVPTLVFTRLLAGPMDYTPGIFNLEIPSKPNNQVNSTLAKQLAFYVIIYSPLQMAADLPENYEGNPAFQFIKDVPCDWEETRVLNGEIGEYVTIIRQDRNSEDWYLGSITNEEPRVFTFHLDFLNKNKDYTAQIYADDENADWKNNPSSIHISEQFVTHKDTLQVRLAPGGGQAIRFIPKQDIEMEE
jgi:alpha-glucosidase